MPLPEELKFLEFLVAGAGQPGKAKATRSEMRKLETPTKRRSLPLPKELKFLEFLVAGAGQPEKRKRLA
ncbi:hypothetical protein [Bacillus timonensis]|uniref:hypothetical protein n=1 Tax=Bacillus timonensis TaxID=1033734 RepID=UPI00028915EC|nr:hypothetical protein [Bacillus timonensis]